MKKLILIPLVAIILTVGVFGAFSYLELFNTYWEDDYFIMEMAINPSAKFLDNINWIDHYTQGEQGTRIFVHRDVDLVHYPAIIKFKDSGEMFVFTQKQTELRREYPNVLPQCIPVHNANGDVVGWCSPYFDYPTQQIKCEENLMCNE